MELLHQLNHWHWWGMGALWIIGEFLAPNGKFLAIGIAAFVTGLLLRLMPDLDWLWQLGGFATLTAIGLLVVTVRASKKVASH